jgi:two-component system chemotaxis response regulator CheB
VLLVMHRHRHGGAALARAIAHFSHLPVRDIVDKGECVPGCIHVCPADYHVLVESDGTFTLSVDPPVNFARPSIDVAMESVALTYGTAAVGVVLSGASVDGAYGLRAIERRGGRAWCQDPATAVDVTLPNAARSMLRRAAFASPQSIGNALATCRDPEEVAP